MIRCYSDIAFQRETILLIDRQRATRDENWIHIQFEVDDWRQLRRFRQIRAGNYNERRREWG